MAEIIPFHRMQQHDSNEDSIETDLTLLAIMYWEQHFAERLKDIPLEVRYALLISTYRFVKEAYKAGEVTLSSKGFTIDKGAGEDLRKKILDAVDYGEKHIMN